MKTIFQSDKKLKDAADIAVKECLKVKKGDNVLIITNHLKDVFDISSALFESCLSIGAKPVIAVQDVKTSRDWTELPIIGGIKSAPDVLISMSAEKMGKDIEAIKKPYIIDGKEIDNSFHYLMEIKKTRSFWSPGITKELFIKTVLVDYKLMKKRCQNLKKYLDKATEVKITAPAGTNLIMGLNNRVAFTDDGDFSKLGDGGNLPAGEAFISPELNRSNGTIAFDGSIAVSAGTLKIKSPILCKVVDGFVTEITGKKEAEVLKEVISVAQRDSLKLEKSGGIPSGSGEIYKKNATNLGELGIGVNPSCEVVGNMLVDEKAFKTCHIAIGSNYDEDAKSLIHLDGVIKNPTIEAKMATGKTVVLLKDGEIII